MDAAIHNFGVNVNVIATPGTQKEIVAQSIITNIKDILTVDKFHINQPISLGDINYAVLSSDGVSSLDNSGSRKAITIDSLTQTRFDDKNTFTYGLSESFNPESIEKGYIFPKKNGIFELKYPDFDIKVSVR